MNLLRKNTGIGTEQKRSRRRSFYDGIFLEGAPSANAESKRTCRPFSNVSAGGLTVSPPATWKFSVMESLCFGIGISPFSEDGQNPEDRILPGKCSTGFSRRTRVNILLFLSDKFLSGYFFCCLHQIFITVRCGSSLTSSRCPRTAAPQTDTSFPRARSSSARVTTSSAV